MNGSARSCNCLTVMRRMAVVIGPVQVLASGDATDGIACTCVRCGSRYVLLSQIAVRAASLVEGWLQDELASGRDPMVEA